MSAVLEQLDSVPPFGACDACGAGGGEVVALPQERQVRLRVEGVSLDYKSDRGVVRATHRVGFDVLPSEQEAHAVGGADRLDVRAQAVQRVAMNPRQQRTIAPFDERRTGAVRRF